VEGLADQEVVDRCLEMQGLAGSLEVVAALEAELELILSTQIQPSHQVGVQLVDHLLRVH
jgi:hypothetical protein